MNIGSDAAARSGAAYTAVEPQGATNTAATDLEARKRRVLKRSSAALAANPATQHALAEGGSIHRIAKGRMLIAQGDPANAIIIVGLGRLRVSRTTTDGRTLSLGYRGAGDVVGEAALGGVTTHRESLAATEDVESLVVPLATMRQLMSHDAAFAAQMIATFVDRQAENEDRLASVLFRHVEARLAEFLLKAAARWGIPDPRGVLIAAPFTHQEMASMIGSTRETVTLTLSELRRKGVLDVDRRRVVVIDREALRQRST